MIPIDPLTATIGFLAWMAFRKQTGSNYGTMTPEREEVFQNAMKFLQDPTRMETLAAEFQKEGLKFQAILLRKRAQWRSRTPEAQEEHNLIFTKAMESENIKGILGVANAFEEMTATLKAKQLRDHASEVHQKNLAKAKNVQAAKKEVEAKKEVIEVIEVPHESNEMSNGAITVDAESDAKLKKPEEATGTES
jgi:hypothetical protein